MWIEMQFVSGRIERKQVRSYRGYQREPIFHDYAIECPLCHFTVYKTKNGSYKCKNGHESYTAFGYIKGKVLSSSRIEDTKGESQK